MNKKDEGSILVLGAGLSVIAIAMITTLVNISTLWIARNALDSVADGAAIAAVQAIDTRTIYTEGLGQSLRINGTASRARAQMYVNKANTQGELHSIRITAITVGAQSVSITLASDIQLPFGYLAATKSVSASSRANAVNQLH